MLLLSCWSPTYELCRASPLASPALQALDTRYFRSHPVCPENISELPPLELPDNGGSYHEFQTKRKRKEDGVMQQDAKRAQKKKVPWHTSSTECTLTLKSVNVLVSSKGS